MSDPITRVSGPNPLASPPAHASGPTPVAAPPAHDGRIEKLRRAAGEFEAIFVKQLLKEANMGGGQKASGGYADMAVDAMADGVQRGGGLGLAKQIERALAASGALGPPAHPATPAVAPTHLPRPATLSPKR